jgi:aspartate aminotransferase
MYDQRCKLRGTIRRGGGTARSQDATHQMAHEYQKSRDILFSALEEAPYLQPFLPGGAFYLWSRILAEWPGYSGKTDDWSMTNYLIDKAGIGSSPGSAFGKAGEGYIRFVFSCSTEQIEEAARLLPQVLRKA